MTGPARPSRLWLAVLRQCANDARERRTLNQEGDHYGIVRMDPNDVLWLCDLADGDNSPSTLPANATLDRPASPLVLACRVRWAALQEYEAATERCAAELARHNRRRSLRSLAKSAQVSLTAAAQFWGGTIGAVGADKALAMAEADEDAPHKYGGYEIGSSGPTCSCGKPDCNHTPLTHPTTPNRTR